MNVIDAALAYASKGLRVIPIAPGEKYPSGIESWQTKATTDPDTITTWFTKTYKGWGVGIQRHHINSILDKISHPYPKEKMNERD